MGNQLVEGDGHRHLDCLCSACLFVHVVCLCFPAPASSKGGGACSQLHLSPCFDSYKRGLFSPLLAHLVPTPDDIGLCHLVLFFSSMISQLHINLNLLINPLPTLILHLLFGLILVVAPEIDHNRGLQSWQFCHVFYFMILIFIKGGQCHPHNVCRGLRLSNKTTHVKFYLIVFEIMQLIVDKMIRAV